MHLDKIADMYKVTDRFVESYIEHSKIYPLHVKDYWNYFKRTTSGINAAQLEVMILK